MKGYFFWGLKLNHTGDIKLYLEIVNNTRKEYSGVSSI